MFTDEHLYSIALRKCNQIGDINFYKLVSAVGSAKEVWGFPKKDLAAIIGIGAKTIYDIGNAESIKFAESELKFCENQQIKINLRHLGDLPNLLNECEDAPAILYQKGEFNKKHTPLSIVGTRNVTHYGKKFLEDFFEEIKESKLTSISGLALGVDTEVHQQSLKHNIPTIAVLAHGFHTLYPSRNKKMSEKILEQDGVLLSEFNSSQKPDRENFIQRNRIIAGLSEATVVVETAFGGGSVSTANFANHYNREVYALPGKITDKYSQGCNQLIAQNKARTISSIKDLIEELDIDKPKSKVGELFPCSDIKAMLSEKQQKIYDILQKYDSPVALDDIAEQCGFPSHKALPILLELELSGFIKTFSGKQFQIA